MSIFRWGAGWNPLHDLERDVDQLLRSMNLTFQGLRFGRQYPAVNLYELPDEFLITAELAGLSSADFELTIQSGVLTMAGRRGKPDGVEEERYRRQERFQGSWKRTITLPERIDESRLSADFEHGVLRIRVPKMPAEEPRRIPIGHSTEESTLEDLYGGG